MAANIKFVISVQLHLFLSVIITTVYGQNQCSMDNGRCTYYVQLADNCGQDMLYTNRIQNDYNARVNEIEKNLVDTKVDHLKRIEELEKKLSTMAGNNVLKPRHVEGGNRVGGKEGPPFPELPDRSEDDLLNQLHKEFVNYRKDLFLSRKKIADTEDLLRGHKIRLNKTVEELERVLVKLAETELLLENANNENERLKKLLADTQNKLNVTKHNLDNTHSKWRKTKRKLMVANRRNNDLENQMKTCEDNLNTTQGTLNDMQDDYDFMKAENKNLTLDLNRTLEELQDCYKGHQVQFCGFEDPGICGFRQDNVTDNFDWTRWMMMTPSAYTGPSKDHTCESPKGHYMYIEATGRSPNNNARLYSPHYQGNIEQCLEFYYHMYGQNIGTLNVYLAYESEDEMPPPLWRAYGDQGNVWSHARVEIPMEIAKIGYKVVFEAILTSGYAGDIALDDVRLFSGPCVGALTLDHIRRNEDDVFRESYHRTIYGPRET